MTNRIMIHKTIRNSTVHSSQFTYYCHELEKEIYHIINVHLAKTNQFPFLFLFFIFSGLLKYQSDPEKNYGFKLSVA